MYIFINFSYIHCVTSVIKMKNEELHYVIANKYLIYNLRTCVNRIFLDMKLFYEVACIIDIVIIAILL